MMVTKVKLSDITDAMEMQFDETQTYLNKATGEIVVIRDEYFRAAESGEDFSDRAKWEQEDLETARKILCSSNDEFVRLPDKFDIHEYQIMERFVLSMEDDEIRDTLYRAIKGRGAFRYFKDRIYELGIRDDWLQYKERAFRNIAKEWCEDNGVEYEDG